jgi:hypothetical protein
MAIMVEIEFLESGYARGRHVDRICTGFRSQRCDDYVDAELFSLEWQRSNPNCTVTALAMKEVA